MLSTHIQLSRPSGFVRLAFGGNTPAARLFLTMAQITCKNCQVTKHEADFHKSKSAHIGRRIVCAECVNATRRTAEYRRIRAAKVREHRVEHHEQHLAVERRYRKRLMASRGQERLEIMKRA